ncbi:hypothetical protein PTSG_00321 [Salpingoeca rosetta]|uniref:phosphoinositide phospholipase C n=1 Tax=Salpingoeca rosetta (strain ATCC 50818 / BSB-021) TaxID=946362 RepID=F2TW56_SALR5|nr:uncharacterized protein PTSG_00321 [Salpingoeca rosetta]EGD72302.1 hypothetical protein PTSG_00321 [Salpingoeca rosetta]|eukprot:XP_004998872.1 hypothetical protein PTSG_00321 [Salpingoeca rosetta]
MGSSASTMTAAAVAAQETVDRASSHTTTPQATAAAAAARTGDPAEDIVTCDLDDMTQPLSHYYIFTAWNAFVDANAVIKGTPSTAALRRVLQTTNARCIHLAVHDRPPGWLSYMSPLTSSEPVVFHVAHAAKPISLRACVAAVRECAFERSSYPLLLLIDDYSSYRSMKAQARVLEEELGDLLFVPSGPATTLHTPQELMHKVVLVHRDNGLGRRRYRGLPPELKRLVYLDFTTFKSLYGSRFAATHAATEFTYKQLEKHTRNGASSMMEHAHRHLVLARPDDIGVGAPHASPITLMHQGVQLAALHLPHADESVWATTGYFRTHNGGAGYVLKPECLRTEVIRCDLFGGSDHALPAAAGTTGDTDAVATARAATDTDMTDKAPPQHVTIQVQGLAVSRRRVLKLLARHRKQLKRQHLTLQRHGTLHHDRHSNHHHHHHHHHHHKHHSEQQHSHDKQAGKATFDRHYLRPYVPVPATFLPPPHAALLTRNGQWKHATSKSEREGGHHEQQQQQQHYQQQQQQQQQQQRQGEGQQDDGSGEHDAHVSKHARGVEVAVEAVVMGAPCDQARTRVLQRIALSNNSSSSNRGRAKSGTGSGDVFQLNVPAFHCHVRYPELACLLLVVRVSPASTRATGKPSHQSKRNTGSQSHGRQHLGDEPDAGTAQAAAAHDDVSRWPVLGQTAIAITALTRDCTRLLLRTEHDQPLKHCALTVEVGINDAQLTPNKADITTTTTASVDVFEPVAARSPHNAAIRRAEALNPRSHAPPKPQASPLTPTAAPTSTVPPTTATEPTATATATAKDGARKTPALVLRPSVARLLTPPSSPAQTKKYTAATTAATGGMETTALTTASTASTKAPEFSLLAELKLETGGATVNPLADAFSLAPANTNNFAHSTHSTGNSTSSSSNAHGSGIVGCEGSSGDDLEDDDDSCDEIGDEQVQPLVPPARNSGANTPATVNTSGGLGYSLPPSHQQYVGASNSRPSMYNPSSAVAVADAQSATLSSPSSSSDEPSAFLTTSTSISLKSSLSQSVSSHTQLKLSS